eukprot:12724813-Alexandrium_andersonii.AAC.1
MSCGLDWGCAQGLGAVSALCPSDRRPRSCGGAKRARSLEAPVDRSGLRGRRLEAQAVVFSCGVGGSGSERAGRERV